MLTVEFKEPKSKHELEQMSFICTIILMDQDGRKVESLISTLERMPKKSHDIPAYQSTLAGKTTVGGTVLEDPEDLKLKIFFIFNNVSVRVQGNYSFLCALMDMNDPEMKVLELRTKYFRVFPVRGYPVGTDETKLSKYLAIHGKYFVN